MYEFLRDLDRRVIFSLMAVAVAVPILLQITPPEKATPIVRDAFETIEALEEGDRVYMAFDFDQLMAFLNVFNVKMMWPRSLHHCLGLP